jgi:diguanylate cyclase (GGDEF)-like protein
MIRALGEPVALDAAVATRVEDVPAPALETTPLPPEAREGRPRVLVVDDVASNRELLRQELGDAGFDVRSQASGVGCLELAARFDPAVIVLDIDMPGMDGIETCRRLKADPTTAHIPILFLTGQNDEETAVVALGAGGNDFLHKPYSRSILLARVGSQIAIHDAQASLRRIAITDALTGLFSRRFLFDALRQQIHSLSRSETPVISCLMVDVDHFKSVNDRFGHQVGDRTLVRVAEALRVGVRAGDVAARFGGEEFVVALPATRREGAAALAEKLRATVETATAPPPGEDGAPVTLSIGVATRELEGTGAGDAERIADALIHDADDAVYQAKRAGRNRVVTAP